MLCFPHTRHRAYPPRIGQHSFSGSARQGCRAVVCWIICAFFISGCHAQQARLGTIGDAVEYAHRKNLKAITIPLPIAQKRSISSLGEELKSSFAFVVEPVGLAVTVDQSRDDILTWYKFKVIHGFSHAPLHQHEDEATLLSNLPDFPRQFLPIAKDEIVVNFVGGQMVIDGVRVTYGIENTKLAQNQRYVLFVGGFIFSGSKRSSTGFSPLDNWSSIFRVEGDGETLVPLHPDASSPVQGLVKEEFGGHLFGMSRQTPEIRP